jgi:hypothetical protein
MADFTALNQAVTDLQAEVMATIANMDKLMADLTAAQSASDQPAVDSATTALQAEINKLKAAVTTDAAP